MNLSSRSYTTTARNLHHWHKVPIIPPISTKSPLFHGNHSSIKNSNTESLLSSNTAHHLLSCGTTPSIHHYSTTTSNPTTTYIPNFHNVLYSSNYQTSPSSNNNNNPSGSSTSQQKKTGLFHYSQLKQAFDLYQMRKEAQEKCEILREEITKSREKSKHDASQLDIRHILNQIDEVSNTLCIFLDLVEFLRNVHPNEEYQRVANETWHQFHAYLHSLNVDLSIHDTLRDIIDENERRKRDPSNTLPVFNEEDDRVAYLLKMDMEKNGGVHNRDQLDTTRIREMNEHIDQLMGEYVQCVQENDQSNLAPENQLWLTEQQVGHLKRNIFRSSMVPVLAVKEDDNGEKKFLLDAEYAHTLTLFSSDPEIRKAAYITANSATPKGQEKLQQLVQARHAYAKYMQFPSYAHWSTKQNLIKTPENAIDFLTRIHDLIQPKLKQELGLLQSYKTKQEGSASGSLYDWDRPYYKRLVQKKLGLNKRLSPYFPLHKCLEGIYMVCEQVFSLRLEPVPMKEGEAWDPTVRKLEVIHQSQGVLGYIYLDLYHRPNKLSTCANFSVRVAKKLIGQKPMACMVCAFDRSSTNLTFNDVTTLFHEFGHALHTVIGQSNYQNTSGTRTVIDFVEMPSQFMEHFVTDYRVVQRFATHYKTGETLPQELFQKQLAKDRSFAALDMQEQLLLSLADLKIFGVEGAGAESPAEIFRQVKKEFSSFPVVPGTHPESKFLHFSNYAAGYYAYLYCKMCSSHIYHKYFSEDPFNRDAGEAYISKVLSPGGSKSAEDILHDMLGEDPDAKYLLNDIQIEDEVL